MMKKKNNLDNALEFMGMRPELIQKETHGMGYHKIFAQLMVEYCNHILEERSKTIPRDKMGDKKQKPM